MRLEYDVIARGCEHRWWAAGEGGAACGRRPPGAAAAALIGLNGKR